MLMVGVVGVFALVLIVCGNGKRSSNPNLKIQENDITTQFGPSGWGYLYTVNHDGCKFVVAVRSGAAGVSVTHHPKCPSCNQEAKGDDL